MHFANEILHTYKCFVGSNAWLFLSPLCSALKNGMIFLKDTRVEGVHRVIREAENRMHNTEASFMLCPSHHWTVLLPTARGPDMVWSK